MSDPQQTTATPPPSAPTQTSEVTSVGTGPNQVIFADPAPVTPVEAPPAAPTTPDPYRVSELENGQFEVVLDSGQTYKGSQADVVRELAKAQYNATKRIAELNGKMPPAPAEPPPPGVDPTALALADLAAQGMGYKNAADMQAVFAPLQEMQQFMQQQQLNNTAAQFLASTPDFPNSPENGDKLDAALAQFNLPATVETLQLVHNHLKATGQYVRVAVPATRQAQGNPLPPNGHSTEPQALDPWSMSLEELGAMIRRN